MPILTFETVIRAPLAAVWAFLDEPSNLPLLMLGRAQLKSADRPMREGSRVVIEVNGWPRSARINWVARIVEHRPPHAVVFGEEARFVDEMEEGPLACWRHEHDLEAIDAKTTRMVDRVTYRAPAGPLGWIADWVMIRRQVRREFRTRSEQMRKRLEQP